MYKELLELNSKTIQLENKQKTWKDSALKKTDGE